MSAAHGFFSLGGVLAGLGSFLIVAIGNPALHMAYAVALVIIVNLFLYKKYLHIRAAPVEKEGFSLKLVQAPAAYWYRFLCLLWEVKELW